MQKHYLTRTSSLPAYVEKQIKAYCLESLGTRLHEVAAGRSPCHDTVVDGEEAAATVLENGVIQ